MMCGYTHYLVDFARILRKDAFEILSIVLPDNRSSSDLMRQTLGGLKQDGLPYIYQPPDEPFAQMVSRKRPDILFCFSHTRKIPTAVLAVEEIRKVNCHLGLLPEYRCLNPVNRAIMNGDTQAGFTLHELVEEMDAGDIFHRKTVPVDKDDTALSVTLKLVERLICCLPSLLRDIHSGRLKPIPQDPAKARYYPPINYVLE